MRCVVNPGYLPMKNSPYMAKTILERLSAGPLPDWHRVEADLRVKQVAAGDCLFMAEERHPYVYFVGQGIIKMVYDTMDGKGWIKAFADEGRFFASLTGLEPHGKTSFSAYAVSDATVEQVPYRTLLDLADSYPNWQRTLRRAFEIYGFHKEKREKELLTLSAAQRYLNFINEREGLATRLTDKDIAAYIRITPVALSRIKKRVRDA